MWEDVTSDIVTFNSVTLPEKGIRFQMQDYFVLIMLVKKFTGNFISV